MRMAVDFFNDESGVTAIEYGLIAALIAVLIFAAVTGSGGNLRIIFTTICNTLNDVLTTVNGGPVGCPA